jgi:hypothetical protein
MISLLNISSVLFIVVLIPGRVAMCVCGKTRTTHHTFSFPGTHVRIDAPPQRRQHIISLLRGYAW